MRGLSLLTVERAATSWAEVGSIRLIVAWLSFHSTHCSPWKNDELYRKFLRVSSMSSTIHPQRSLICAAVGGFHGASTMNAQHSHQAVVVADGGRSSFGLRRVTARIGWTPRRLRTRQFVQVETVSATIVRAVSTGSSARGSRVSRTRGRRRRAVVPGAPPRNGRA